jgi:ABC-type nickel/cobalt efflux system permease component RcnA
VAASLLLAAAFGAAHALAPGHGKALTAAYLVGTGARLRHAAGAGLSVAAMHTASVLALGVALTWAERTFPAERVYPWLGLAAGVVALGLGGALLASRLWRSRQTSPGEGEGFHPHPHPHGPSRPGLAALALAGGILPSPSALIVLLGAVALGRTALGLALVAAFGLGLGACLTVIGALALRVRGAAGRRLPASVLRVVPVLSAAAIVVVGAVLTARGAAQL